MYWVHDRDCSDNYITIIILIILWMLHKTNRPVNCLVCIAGCDLVANIAYIIREDK